MTKDLYYTIPEYFIKRMREHSNVESIQDQSTEDYFIFRVNRLNPRDSVRIWLSDAYRFTEMDFHNRPEELEPGDYALIAKPEGGGGVSYELIKDARIGVGKLAELMGALTKRNMWEYEPPTWEERQRRKKAWESRPRR